MKEQLFDDFVKDKLENYDSGAPMQVWERIREKEKEDKKGFYFFKRYGLTGIALVALTGIAFLTWNANSKNKTQEQKTITASQIKSKNQHSTERSIEPSAESAMKKESGKNESTPDFQNEINTTPAIHAGVNTQSNKVVTSNDIVVNKKKSIANRIFQKYTTANTVSSGFISESKQKKAASINAGNEMQESNNIQSTNTKEYALAFTNMADYRFSLKKFQLGNVPQTMIRPGCPTINGPRRNDLYIEVYGSPDYTMRSFSNPSTLNNYIARRRTTEDNRNGFSAGIRVAKNIGEKTVLKTGINYSQINERLRIINENEKQLTQIITIRTVIRAPGDTLFIRDTTYFEQNGTRYRTTYNRYRFIDLPIIFSYEFGNPEILASPVISAVAFSC